MNKRQQAIELLEIIPENKLDYIIAFLQGAAIPDRPMEEGIPESEESAELPDSVRGLEKSMQTLFSGDAMLEEQMMDEAEARSVSVLSGKVHPELEKEPKSRKKKTRRNEEKAEKENRA